MAEMISITLVNAKFMAVDLQGSRSNDLEMTTAGVAGNNH